MVSETEIKKQAIERAGDTVVKCPYCGKLHSVSSGWYFSDNPDATLDGDKIRRKYITKQLDKFLKVEE